MEAFQMKNQCNRSLIRSFLQYLDSIWLLADSLHTIENTYLPLP